MKLTILNSFKKIRLFKSFKKIQIILPIYKNKIYKIKLSNLKNEAFKTIIVSSLVLAVSLLNSLLVNLINASYQFGEYGPFFCNYIYYFCCLTLLLHKKNWNWKRLWTRLICGVIDAIGGICITYSYKFTAPASATLLVSVSTPFSMLFSFLINKNRYNWLEIALMVCTVGFAAGFAGSDFSGTNWIGSVLAIVSGAFYGLGVACNERFAADISIAQFLGQMGISGFSINFVASMITEIKVYEAFNWQIVLIQVSWGVGLFIWYWLAVALIQQAGGVILSLSLLSSNIFTFPLGILIFKNPFVWWQILLAIGLLGCIVAFLFVNDIKMRKQEEMKKLAEADVVVVEDTDTGIPLEPGIVTSD